jgi:ribosomal-protein-alanine N-acetyltransferase
MTAAGRIWTGGAADSDLLARLHSDVFPDAWPAEAFASLLARDEVLVLLAARGDTARAEGFILLRTVAGEAEVLTFCVANRAQRCGLGTALLDAACAAAHARGATALFLEVGENNTAARALYQKEGFIVVGRRAAYYQHGPEAADAIVMRRLLADPIPQ